MTTREQLQLAIQHHQAGRLAEARVIYQKILAVQPEDADCHYMLATVLADLRQLQDAAAEYRRAIDLKPSMAAAHNDLGNVWRELGNLPDAIDCYRKVVKLASGMPQVHYNLANALADSGQLDEAVTCYQTALRIKPDYAQAGSNLGGALLKRGKTDEAIACFNRAIAADPHYAVAHCALAGALLKKGQYDKAIESCNIALRIKPNFAAALNNLATAWKEKGQPNQALELYQRALALEPGFADALNNLGKFWIDQGKPDEAIKCLESALARQKDFIDALGNLGNALKCVGELDQAIARYRQCLALNPDSPNEHGSLLFTLTYHPDTTPELLFAEGKRWNDQHAKALGENVRPHDNDRDPNRRLRIGYVSPDFRAHPVGRFMLSLLASHDRSAVEVFCYAELPAPDEISGKFQVHCDVWRKIDGLSDEETADLIRRDQIDILVDLALHTKGNRLLVFARKPAPVQVTFAGYPGSTGLDAIDYRLTDPWLDPPGLFDDFCSEKSVRLPDTFWCDQLMSDQLPVGELPALSNSHVTFGSLNNFCKINDSVIGVWAKVLHRVSDSRLLLLAPPGNARHRILDRFNTLGVDPQRITLIASQPRQQYLLTYHQIDIGLDPWPYGGHSTSFDALWMGVPQVTLVGQTVVGRAGFSQLSNLGLTELIAYTPDQYVQIAADLAHDLPRLAELRGSLRERMRKSPLTDGTRFARGVEEAFRRMWRQWFEDPA